MTLQSASEHLQLMNPTIKILQFDGSSATVEEAANVLGVEPARIAKSLSFKIGDEPILVVTAGDAKIDNAKYKQFFKAKAKMLKADEVEQFTSHPIGGVCPFGLAHPMKVYLDVSLKRFTSVYPACGSRNSAIEATCEELEHYVPGAKWVDVCKGWQFENQDEAIHEHTI